MASMADKSTAAVRRMDAEHDETELPFVVLAGHAPPRPNEPADAELCLGGRHRQPRAKKRAKIWTNLLSAARIEGIDVDSLVDVDLNGRQIKTAIRLAQTMARAEDSHVDTDAMRRVIDFVQLFEKQQKKKSKKEK